MTSFLSPVRALGELQKKLTNSWKANSKFTIHPFKSLHSKHLLPLSITDYVARFSLELVVLGIAMVAIFTNMFIRQHVSITSSDESVLFSFIKNSSPTNPLLATGSTSTILTQTDQLVNRAQASSFQSIVLANQTTKSKVSTASTIQDDVIVKTNPADTQNFARHGLTTYTVQSGDTIIGVASNFGISPATIMKENKIDASTTLKPGQELTILPTTGITYNLTEKDTMESLMTKYKLSEDDFLDANNIESFDDLEVGTTVVIPMDNVALPQAPKPVSRFVRTDSGKVALKTAAAPEDLVASAINFIWPTSTHSITQGYSSRHTGIDTSNSHMEPIYAAADGFIEISGYQSNGYGNTIVINHGNGYKTRYGHASELYVAAGDYVKQGQTIAKQGRTGRVRGATGIHLHFEVIKNGKRVNPLTYVKP